MIPMKREGTKLILGMNDCNYCHNGQHDAKMPCPECKGTGRGKRGQEKGCKKCYGMKWQWDSSRQITCEQCHGNYANITQQTTSDYLPKDILRTIPVKFTKENRPQSLNEYLLGIGFLYTCTDYGRAWKNTAETELTEEIYNHSCQACKVVNKNNEFCEFIEVQIHPGGYSVKAIFTP